MRKRMKEYSLPAGTGDLQPIEVRLTEDVRGMIDTAREQVARTVNAGLVVLYWSIGARIRQEILGAERADYGERIVRSMGERLSVEYGRGFSGSNLFQMIRFAELFPDPQIVQTLSVLLSWSHVIQLIHIDDPLKREFYTEMCRVERWSVRTLRAKIDGMLFERTALSRKPQELARQELAALREEDRLTPDLVFRDPYFLDFLRLSDTYSERDLESAIIREMERFLMELGADFAFLARQKRITIGGEDFYLDLLFYHRGLRRLVAIELKLGQFRAEHKGQMELYLRWLDKYERRPGEDAPLGLILCAGANSEQVELLQLDHGEIRVCEYLTELPARALLEEKLRSTARMVREQKAAYVAERGDIKDEVLG